MEGYSDFAFLNSAGQVYTNSFLHDIYAGIMGCDIRTWMEVYAKAAREKKRDAIKSRS